MTEKKYIEGSHAKSANPNNLVIPTISVNYAETESADISTLKQAIKSKDE